MGNLFLEERKGRRLPHILTYEEETKLLAISGPLLKVLVVVLVETGLRVGKEALPLKWGDIDLTNGTLCVRESKTLAGRRMVPLSDYCKAELLRWRALTGPEYSEYVFFNDRNPSAHLLKLPKTWKRALKKANIGYFPIYNLRHTFATRMQEAGTSPVTLSQMMGHSSTGIIQTYAKVLDQYRLDAVKKLDAHRLSNKTVSLWLLLFRLVRSMNRSGNIEWCIRMQLTFARGLARFPSASSLWFLSLTYQEFKCGGDAAEFMGQFVGASRPPGERADGSVKRINQSNNANEA
jgi:hypothetical protein